MLRNDSVALYCNDQALYVVGVEDPHFHKNHDLNKAFNAVPDEAFVLFLAHSPELYEEALRYKTSFYVCGHTHNGQIRFPRIGALTTNCSVPKRFTNGAWRHFDLQGYTGSGVGTSLLPIRFLCPPEISLLTLRKNSGSL